MSEPTETQDVYDDEETEASDSDLSDDDSSVGTQPGEEIDRAWEDIELEQQWAEYYRRQKQLSPKTDEL